MDLSEFNWLDNIADWILLISTAVALVFSIVHRHKKFIFPFQYYIVASFVLAVFLKSFDFIKVKDVTKFTSPVLLIYSLIEISAILYFYSREIKKIRFRILAVGFFIVYAFFFVMTCRKPGLLPITFTAENILVTIASLYYIISVLKKDEIVDRGKDPSFIAACGILFYFCISSPYYPTLGLVRNFSLRAFQLFVFFNNTLYSVVFLGFIFAYKCPPKQRTSRLTA